MSKLQSQDPRIAPKEMIVTRFKSAQQRRQLREKDRSMTKVTQLLKSPPQKKLKKGKGQKSVKCKEKRDRKSSIQIDEDDSKDYYPEKLKRGPRERKVFLKPKPNMKMVARTNKRKFNTPRKGIKSPITLKHKQKWPEEFDTNPGKLKCQSPVFSELSMEEVIRIVEDTESLDDEDLMEILTCPSPVWWEEPPDEMYIEEAICSRKPDESLKSPIKERCRQTYSRQAHIRDTRRRLLKEESNITNNRRNSEDVRTNESSDKNLNNSTEGCVIEDFKIDTNDISKPKDEKFLKKNKKLENVLGNIKNKARSSKDVNSSKVLDNKFVVKSEEAEETKNTLIKKENHESKILTAAKESVIDAKEINIGLKKETKIKKISESTDGDTVDLNFRDDEMLLDLENIDIPIENDCVQRPMSPESVILVTDDDNDKKIDVDADEIDQVVENSTHSVLSNRITNSDGKIDKCLNGNNDLSSVAIDSEDNSERIKANLEEIDVNKEENINTGSQDVPDKMELHEEAIPKQIEVPKNLPPLKKRPKFDNTVPSPVSYRSIADDTTESSSVSSHEISDTISVTNMKFIMDEDVDDVSDAENKNEIATKDSKDKVDKYILLKDHADLKNEEGGKSNNDSYITVYKILETEKPHVNRFKNIPEYSNYVENLKKAEISDEKGQINSFFKKCKNANRKRCKKLDIDNDAKVVKIDVKSSLCESCEPKKSITVAQDENVKYCLKCSSIFDTEECSYCQKSTKESENSSNNNCATECSDFANDSDCLDSHKGHSSEEPNT